VTRQAPDAPAGPPPVDRLEAVLQQAVQQARQGRLDDLEGLVADIESLVPLAGRAQQPAAAARIRGLFKTLCLCLAAEKRSLADLRRRHRAGAASLRAYRDAMP
jgi:hypothetical protein